MSCWKEVAFLLVALMLERVGADCVAGFQEVSHGLIQVVLPTRPGTWEQMQEICSTEFDGQSLLPLYANVTEEQKKMCGDSLLPVFVQKQNLDLLYIGHREATQYDLHLYDPHYPRLEEGFGVMNLTDGLWHLVDRDQQFNCAMCQREMNAFVFDMLFYPESFEISGLESYQITFVSREVHAGLALISADENERLVKMIETTLENPMTYKNNRTTSLRKVFIDSNSRLVLIFHYNLMFLNWDDLSDIDIVEAARGIHTTTTLEDYEMEIVYISECQEEVTIGMDNKLIIWPKSRSGKIATNLEESTRVITRRECTYNETEYRHFWSPSTFWEIVWEPCSLEDQYVNEVQYQDHLGSALASKHNNLLHQFTKLPTNETTLDTIVKIISNDVRMGKELNAFMVGDLETILLMFPLRLYSESYILTTLLIQLVVIDWDAANPHDGITFAYEHSSECGYECPMEPVTVQLTGRRINSVMTQREKFAVQLSDGFNSASLRLAFVVAWKAINHDSKEACLSSEKMSRFPIIYIALALNAEYTAGMSLGDDTFYVEIAYEPSFHNKDIAILSSQREVPVFCAAWNNALHDWTTSGCRQLKAKRGNRTVCRCRGKYFLQEGTKLTAKYALLEQYAGDPNFWSSVFKDHTGLAVSMAIEVILSGFGLLSIIMTAILFKKWRDNSGHKILMHMVMALTCNLVLGFTTTLAQFDTESVSCLTVGVLRHFSFLSMFLWMFVMSGLQLKRLTTVAGAKTTSHLILKVALFAWGVPLVPIVILLAWNTRFYRGDRFDRGYCYPEGFAFELTVQAPAGVILVVNFGVFVKILRHIFECSGETIMKHSKNDRAQKLNRLKTSLFIFFLFGFTWIFHFLSEERVINSDFLFEYLFLMTATFHLLMLALFFIIFQDSTRGLWLLYLGVEQTPIIVRKLVIRKPKTPQGN